MTSAELLIAKAEGLLLDFDGPVTALMPPPLNAAAADRARALLGGVELPAEVERTTDHLAVLRWTAAHRVGRLADVERACTEFEVDCARASAPSPEIRELLEGARGRQVPVAIVSNNSEQAIRTFLDRCDWAAWIGPSVGRTLKTARLMKPNPFYVNAAVRMIGIDRSRCVFIGDSVSDVSAGQAAGVPVIGLAKTPQRGADLEAAGVSALMRRQPSQ